LAPLFHSQRPEWSEASYTESGPVIRPSYCSASPLCWPSDFAREWHLPSGPPESIRSRRCERNKRRSDSRLSANSNRAGDGSGILGNCPKTEVPMPFTVEFTDPAVHPRFVREQRQITALLTRLLVKRGRSEVQAVKEARAMLEPCPPAKPASARRASLRKSDSREAGSRS